MKIVFKNFKYISWWRVFIILGIPFLLSFWFFIFPWTVEFKSELTQTVDFTTDKIEELKYSESDYEQLTKNFLSEVLNIPLDFKTISLCFQNVGNYIEFENPQGIKRIYPTVQLQLTSKKNHTVGANETVCEIVEVGNKFTPTLFTNLNLTLIKLDIWPDGTPFVSIDVVRQTRLFGKKNLIEVIQKSIILFLAWFGSIWLLTRMWTLIKENLKKA